MLQRLRRITAPPRFEDEDKTRVGRLLHVITASIVVLTLVYIVTALFTRDNRGLNYAALVVLVSLGVNLAERRGYVRAASLCLCSVIWIIFTIPLYFQGIFHVSYTAYLVPVLIAGFLLGARFGFIFATLSTVSGLIVLNIHPQMPTFTAQDATLRWVSQATFMYISVVLLALATDNITQALGRARRTESDLAQRNRELEREVIERKNAEESYRVLVENSVQGLVIYQDNRIVYVNGALCKIFSIPVEEMLGSHDIRTAVFPDDWAMFSEKMAQRAAGNTEPAHYEFRAIDRNGKIIWLEAFVVSTLYRGRPAVQAALLDVTERKRAEKQTIELAVAKEREDNLREFISTMSHDLKTPLTVMNTSLYLLERINDPVKQKDRIVTLKNQVALLERFIQDILVISRLDHTPGLNLKLVDLNRLAQDIERRLLPAAEGKNLRLGLDLSATTPTVLGDESELERALLNLVENAISYTPREGSVIIRTARQGENAIIEVVDSGIGVAEGDLPKIFDRFYRSMETQNMEPRGTGLGLAIVKQILDLHGGNIEVESAVGKGSTFRVQLPLLLEMESGVVH